MEINYKSRNKILIFSCILLAIICMALCINYFIPKTEYYLDYTTVNGVPQGIHELSEKEISGMHAHYAFVSSKGKIREVRYENSYGKLVSNKDEFPLRPSKSTYFYYDNGNVKSAEYYNSKDEFFLALNYDETAGIIDLSNYSADKNEYAEIFEVKSLIYKDHLPHTNTSDEYYFKTDFKKIISRIIVDYDENGYTKEIRYALNKDNLAVNDISGISGMRFDRDEKGRTSRLLYLTNFGGNDAENKESYKVAGTRRGFYGMNFEYNENDTLSSRGYFDEENKPFLFDFTIVKYDYNDKYNLSKKTYFVANGELRAEETYYEYEYDKHGNMIREYCPNPIAIAEDSPKPITTEWKYDEYGNNIFFAYYDAEGNSTRSDLLIPAEKFEYDENGNIIKNYILDHKLKSEADFSVGASHVYAYDENNRKISSEFYNYTGKLDSRTEYEYDEKDNIICETLYDYYNKNVIVKKYDYDEYGNIISIISTDENGNPSKDLTNVGKEEFGYDKDGRLLLHKLYRKDGSFWFGYEDVYENGFLIKKTKLRESEGNKYVDIVKKYEYDDSGNLILVSNYDTNNNPYTVSDGYSVIKYNYDNKGNRIKTEYLDKNLKPIEYFEYDDNGYVSSKTYYDADGNAIKEY